MVTKDKFSKIPEGSNESIGDYSANLSEIAPNVLSLDEISPVDGLESAHQFKVLQVMDLFRNLLRR